MVVETEREFTVYSNEQKSLVIFSYVEDTVPCKDFVCIPFHSQLPAFELAWVEVPLHRCSTLKYKITYIKYNKHENFNLKAALKKVKIGPS